MNYPPAKFLTTRQLSRVWLVSEATIKRWADTPALGVFFDHAPSGPYQIGPVAHAVRTARRLIGEMIVLNPGTDVDPT